MLADAEIAGTAALRTTRGDGCDFICVGAGDLPVFDRARRLRGQVESAPEWRARCGP